MSARFLRLDETTRQPVTIQVDGETVRALQGDTVLVAILCTGQRLRASEFGDGTRAGFCLMGACQDCWVWAADGGRIRACSTPVSAGMCISTRQPEPSWSDIA